MASGEEKGELGKTQDQVLDYICTLCTEKGKELEAEFYCGKCKQYLCLNCESVHQSLLSDHKVAGKVEKSRWGVSVIEECDQHGGKEIELYCVKHQALCCCVCISMKHRTCEDVQYIPEAAKTFSTGEELPKTIDGVNAAIANLQKVKADRENSKKKLIKSKENFKAFSRNVEERFVKKLGDLHKNAEEEMEVMFAELDKNLQADVETCDEYLEDLQKMSQDPSTALLSDIQRFIHTKRMQMKTQEGSNQLQKMSSRILKDHFAFKVDSKLEKVIEGTEKLGKFEALVPGVQEQEEQIVQCQSGMNTHERHGNPSTKPDVHDVHKVKVKQECRTVYDNKVIEKSPKFAQNQKGELFCLANKIIYSVSLESSKMNAKKLTSTFYGSALCFIAGNDLALICSNKEIAICRLIGSTLTMSKGFSVKDCSLLKSRCNSLFTSDTSEIIIYSGLEIVNGHVVSFDTDKCQIASFGTLLDVKDFDVSLDGRLLYIAGECSGFVTMDTRGNVLSRLHDERLIGVTGVCVGRDEKVFVLNRRTRQVLQIDKYGTMLEGVVADGLGEDNFKIFFYMGKKEDSLLITKRSESYDILVLKLAGRE